MTNQKQVQKNRKRVCEPLRQVSEIIEDANTQGYRVAFSVEFVKDYCVKPYLLR